MPDDPVSVRLLDRGWVRKGLLWEFPKVGIEDRSVREAWCIQNHIDAQERHGWRAGSRAEGGAGKQPMGYPYEHLEQSDPPA